MKADELLKLIESYGDGGGGILNLSNRNISVLPAEIGRLIRLKSLILNNNLLTELPPEIGNLHDLIHLQIADNHLRDLPSELVKLPNLWYVNLSCNRFNNFPIAALGLPSLLHLDISSNQISELPAKLYQKTRLQILELQHNRLKSLAKEITNLRELRTLDISNNQLTLLPFGLPDTQQLVTFDHWVNIIFWGNPLLIPPDVLGMDNREHFIDFGWMKYLSLLEQSEFASHLQRMQSDVDQIRSHLATSREAIEKRLRSSPQGKVAFETPPPIEGIQLVNRV
jgi:Leucine-rich repeat (LRR) protein